MDMWMMDGIIELVAVSTMCPKEKRQGGSGLDHHKISRYT